MPDALLSPQMSLAFLVMSRMATLMLTRVTYCVNVHRNRRKAGTALSGGRHLTLMLNCCNSSLFSIHPFDVNFQQDHMFFDH